MKNPLVDKLGLDFPLFAFSHCRDVVAAVSKAGGFGMFGAANVTAEELEVELAWIDAHVDGKPYGVDLLFPENMASADEPEEAVAGFADRIPAEHLNFVAGLMTSHGVRPPADLHDLIGPPPSLLRAQGRAQLDVAFNHPIRLIVNGLGLPPPEMFDKARAHGIAIGAMAGSKEHAIRHVQAGVDLVVAQGGEAGGHCGEVSTLVLVPEVVRAVKKVRDVPVLAAGGIVTGRQMAGCMAMGAAGAWTGSVWLSTVESEVSRTFRDKMIEARSRDTLRSKGRTGKLSRQLCSPWTAAWERGDGPQPLAMPLQSMLVEPALRRMADAADQGNERAREAVTYWVGQGVGLINEVRSARQVVQEFMEEYAEGVSDLQAMEF